MVSADSMSKGKQIVFDICSSSEEGNVEDDDEDEEESDYLLEQGEEDDDDISEGEEEDPERQAEEYDDEESESDQEEDVVSDESSYEDEEFESISNEGQSSEDDDGKGCDLKEGKPTYKELSDKVVNLLRQRNKKMDVLKLEECKAYLRKQGLMLSGSKATCIQRILEHWRLKEGNGERLYPKSSFTINCTGDVCKGDVVMFKQRVYEKFDKVSRRGKEIGKRTIACRIVKESYGDSKQQHTFTVEVLWSKGVKPLPPLYPLLVKGRNLYRYKTYRQHWRIEAERSQVLEEKHRRGATARHVRASTKARISAGSKRQRRPSTSRQEHNKRLKDHSKATPRKQGQKTCNAKARVNSTSNKKHAASASSVKHSKKSGTKTTPAFQSNKFKTKKSSHTNPRQANHTENETKPLHFSSQRPTFENIYNNSHADLHRRNSIAAPQAVRERLQIPSYNYNNSAGPAFPLMRETFHDQMMRRGTSIRQPYAVHASQFSDPRGRLGHPYSTSISQYASRSSAHFFTPDFYGNKFADFQFNGRRQP